MSTPAPPAPDGGQPAAPAAPPPAPAPTSTPPPAPAPQNQPTPPAAPPVPTPPTWTPPQAQDPAVDPDEVAKLPQWAQKKFRDLRDENARYRTTAKAETVLRHAYTTAGAHGVNPDALLGSVAFAEHAKHLDPNAEDFPAKLAAAVQAALAANPWMAAPAVAAPPPTVPAPPAASGGDFQGGNGGGAPAKTLAEQIAEAESKGDWKTARQFKAQLMLQQTSQ